MVWSNDFVAMLMSIAVGLLLIVLLDWLLEKIS